MACCIHGGHCVMANPNRRKRRKNTVWRGLLRLFFLLLLLSLLAAYISNQVAISSRRAELQTLNEQIAQQKTQNEEMERILSGDADEVTEWVARDSYNYAAPNERIFVDRQLSVIEHGAACPDQRESYKEY